MNAVLIGEFCLGCNGDTRLRNHRNELTSNPCPWCDGAGKVDKTINDCFMRIHKATCNAHKCNKVFSVIQ